MFTNRFLCVQRLKASIIVWRHILINPVTQISTSNSQELYNWNLAMTHSNKRKTPKNTLALFDKLITQHPHIIPDFITYLLALGACVRLGNLDEGKRIHEYIRQRWSTTIEKSEEIKIHTCLIQLYATCGDIKTAEDIFYKENLNQQAIPVNTLMRGYIKNNRADLAVQLAEHLPKNQRNIVTFLLWANAIAQIGDIQMTDRIHGELNTLSSSVQAFFSQDSRLMNALIDMDGKCGNIVRMEDTFKNIQKPDIISYTTMAKSYIVNNSPVKALAVYDHLKQTNQVECDEVIYLVASNAAGKLGLLSRARSIHNDIISSGIPYEKNEKILNTLMDTYGKCGDLDSAREIFNKLKIKSKPSISSMINIYGINSQALEAVALFYETKNNLLGNIESILLSVLTACAHGGLIKEAQHIFDNIPNEKRTVKMWNALVDVYGRAGQLSEAHSIIRLFETTHLRAPVLYISLLAACRTHKNAKLAIEIHDELIESHIALTDDQRSAIVVLTANVCASIGDHNLSFRLRQNLYRNKIPKYSGVTLTEINGEVFEFYAQDVRHSRSKEIYAQLEILHDQLIKLGYQPNESVLTKDELNAEWSIYAHSERLAIAFNLISTSPGTTIQLTKNLRMCIDCHEVSKLIARLTQREIIARDRLRIHYFTKDGRCSCDDHF
ncbi:unnamed protein product [Rotaria magnacalcarata]|uniref:DYW domain-containing protein n=1 Tax=Rotaria magnacalcarata TaxID=392030 RepID=A0A815GRA2_9BILA|nr:unnamed protein product [Rotaria magnacalcarata]CAF1606112.1 unnamed protein product [Rotaria magnacalcarata]CAF2111273.1 unnamed protein product [Rotaria magnacalcarata]CAF2215262.1 unnamed protein product [Rotaria magnacalcarata]CAF3850520.1 unnamed protein product [Rotaria magnacalcarata]